jgi:hypothetical protein
VYGIAKDFIGTLGFPIFVSVFLLIRFEKRLELFWEEQKETNTILTVLMKVLTADGTITTPIPAPQIVPESEPTLLSVPDEVPKKDEVI